MRGLWCLLVLDAFISSSMIMADSGIYQVKGNEYCDQVIKVSSDSSDSYPLTWVSDLFYRALANYTVRDVGSTACRTQTAMYEQNLQNYTKWAVQMAESWERYPTGILGGNKYHMGIYDECVNIHHPIRGQYCLSEIKLIPLNKNNNRFKDTKDSANFDINHAWSTILGWVDNPNQVQRNILNLGICIPSACSASDLEISLQNNLDKVFSPEGVKPVVKIDPLLCTVSGDMYPYNTAYYVTCTIFLFLVLLCSCVTIYHFIELSSKKNKEEIKTICNQYFYSFSFITTGKELIKYDKDNELNVITGSKVMVMLLLILGHKYMYATGFPMSNPDFVEHILNDGQSLIVSLLMTQINGVDPFFFISGLLMYITVEPIFRKEGSVGIKIISQIIYRLLRFLPAYCAIIVLLVNILPHLGDGPLWNQKMSFEAELCKNYWWTNLLFITNFIDSKYQCLIISWQISCDIQFYIIGIIMIYLYTKDVKFTIRLHSLIIGLSIFIPFIVTYLTKSDGILKIYLPVLENLRSSTSFNVTYRPSYMRATPFFSGLAMGFAMKPLKENKIKFTYKTVYSVTFFVVVICYWIQSYGVIFYNQQRTYYPWQHALFAALYTCTQSIICTCLCIFHFTGGYGLPSKVFGSRFFVILGRLSYSVCLVNFMVLVMSQSSQRSPAYISVLPFLEASLSTSVKIYFISLALYLVVEAPFLCVTKILFGQWQKIIASYTLEIQTKKPMDTSDADVYVYK